MEIPFLKGVILFQIEIIPFYNKKNFILFLTFLHLLEAR